MNDFLKVSNAIKQALAEDFSKKNPGVTPDEACDKSKRGGLVFDTIDEVFNPHKHSSSNTAAAFELMAVDEDVRYSDCRSSQKSTRRMAEFLSQDKESKFNALDKSSLFQVLTKREQSLAEYGYAARNAKTELVRMMDNLEKAVTQVQDQVETYMQYTHKQLEMQKSILQKETELGEQTVPSIKRRFNKLLTDANALNQPSSVKTISDMCGIVQQREKVTKRDIASLNGQMIQHSIHAFQEHIEKRKKEVHDISELLPAMEHVLCTLTGKAPEPKPKRSNGNDGSTPRMAKFLNKMKGMFGS